MKTLKDIHKWLGLAFMVFLVGQTISGMLLLYRSPIENFIAGEDLKLNRQYSGVSLDKMLAGVETVMPNAVVSRLQLPADTGHAATVRLYMPDTQEYIFLSLDPETGAVMAPLKASKGLMFWVFRFHEDLLLGDTGAYINAALGIMLLFMSVSGVYFWWLLRKRQKLAIDLSAPPMRKWYDIHRVVGVILAPILVILAVSGAGMTIRGFYLSGSATEQAIESPEYMPLDPIYNEASRAQTIKEVRFNWSTGQAVFMINASDPAWPGAVDRIMVDMLSGRIEKTVYSVSVPSDQKFFAWFYPLHSSLALGSAGRFVLLILGAGLMMLVFSGFILWRIRENRKNKTII
ncbi:PepSY-associated TM helix domain-containing protein [Kordiimonas pumila]|uniref:PepSY-associated TM helix domain-containing protein n=1 Tax=Kordiimonas pumila TaxID=2161677 RepID=A0ABV7D8B7_9PROT|nr:PepSY-associated TM helix domain-containing protein [Kordiimonas pumila]